MNGEQCEIGMIVVVKRRNFLLNTADHGFAAAGYEKDKTMLFAARAAGHCNARVLADLLTRG